MTRPTWGGARAGAGRPAKGPIASEPHQARPHLAPRHPVHVTARVVRGIGGLRHRRAYRAIERALETSLARSDFRIVHLALRRTCVELIVEADDKLALSRGMQGFQVAAARYLNSVASRRGTVFPDRYRAQILTSRQAVRDAVSQLPARSELPAAWPITWLLRVELAPQLRRARPRAPG